MSSSVPPSTTRFTNRRNRPASMPEFVSSRSLTTAAAAVYFRIVLRAQSASTAGAVSHGALQLRDRRGTARRVDSCSVISKSPRTRQRRCCSHFASSMPGRQERAGHLCTAVARKIPAVSRSQAIAYPDRKVTTMTTSTHPKPPIAPPIHGPGAQLAQVRADLHLAHEDVAAKLHLAPRQIKALEQDDYSSLPGATYVRGYSEKLCFVAGSFT